MEIIKDRNAGNSINTYWKPSKGLGLSRDYCIKTGNDYLRNKAGKVRRFSSRTKAQNIIDKLGA